MPGIVLPDHIDHCNCTCTTSAGQNIQMSLCSLIEVMKNIPEIPKIFTMDINVVSSQFLTGNTIILSKTVANALEQAINGDRNANGNSDREKGE